MAYTLELNRRAEKFLEQLAERQPRDYERIFEAIDRLTEAPRPPDCKKLQGRGPLWRIRVGDYRVIYNIFDPDKLIVVTAIVRRTTTTYRGVQ